MRVEDALAMLTRMTVCVTIAEHYISIWIPLPSLARTAIEGDVAAPLFRTFAGQSAVRARLIRERIYRRLVMKAALSAVGLVRMVAFEAARFGCTT